MATLAPARAGFGGDDRFFVTTALLMALVVVAAFSTQLAMGRSTFASPPLVHAHAIAFMGWVALYVMQNVFATNGSIALHRRLGWIGAGWVVVMVALGLAVVVSMARRGQVPFFFAPLNFLIGDPVVLLTFAGLSGAAIALRRRTDWHRRLHFCGMALLVSVAFGRLLPLPLLIPYAFEASVAASLMFPLAGAIADRRRTGAVHPAWWWGIGAMVGTQVLTEAIVHTPLGTAIYRHATAGSPGAGVPPRSFPPPPNGPLRTGRGTSI